MAAPAVIQPIRQSDTGDCAIASIAMVLGLSYQEVANHARTIQRRATKSGLGTRQIVAICRHFGHATRSLRPKLEELDDFTGILLVRLPNKTEHAAILFRGTVYDPADGLLYEPAAYFATEKAHLLRLVLV